MLLAMNMITAPDIIIKKSYIYKGNQTMRLHTYLKASWHSLSFQAILIPLPPPPADAFTMTGYPATDIHYMYF